MRVLLTFRETFRQRACEWLLASYLTIWGVTLLHDGSTFALSPVWDGMAAVASEDTWGIILYVIGAVRLIALLINGSLWPCAHIRTGLAIAGAVMWVQLAILLMQSGFPVPQAYGCLTFTFFEIWNAARAAEDAARADKQAGRLAGARTSR